MNAPRVNEGFRLRARKDGIWEVVWIDPTTGRQCRKSTGTRDKARALDKLPQIKADAHAAKVPDAPTVGWLIDSYLTAVEAAKPEANHAPLRASLRPVKQRLGNLRWDQLSQNEIDTYVRDRLADRRWADHKGFDGKETGTVSKSTVEKDLRMLRAAMNDSYARRYISQPIHFRVKISSSGSRHEWLTRAEVAQLLEACELRHSVRDENGKVIERRRDRNHLWAFIAISIATAARKEAVLSLTWDQVHIPRPEDLPEGTTLLDFKTAKVSGNAYIDFGEGRGNKRRPKMPIGDNPALLSYLLWGGDRSQPYVISYRGKPITDIKKGFAQLLAECGIKKHITPHNLKHTSITWMVESGMPFDMISDLTNTSTKILRKHYSHHRPDYQAALGDVLAV